MSSFDYDMVIIGSGLDGSVAALRAAACPLWGHRTNPLTRERAAREAEFRGNDGGSS